MIWSLWSIDWLVGGKVIDIIEGFWDSNFDLKKNKPVDGFRAPSDKQA